MTQASVNYLPLKIIGFLLVSLFFITPTEQAQAALTAFPGAEGFGRFSIGGRGGEVYIINTLAGSGSGSLREALEARGPRIIVFNVGGVIDLGSKNIVIRNPYVTIAGQTAPGNGIALKNSGITIATHDVIMRGLKIRVGGETGGASPTSRDGLNIIASGGTEPHDIIIDHNSISWAIDENLSTWGTVRDLTFSWNIISEGLLCSINPSGCISYGSLLNTGIKNLSLHHNLYAHNAARSPKIVNGNAVEMINNVVYNWGDSGTSIGCHSSTPPTTGKANLIGNYYKAGPQTFRYNGGKHVGNSIVISRCWETGKVYLQDNSGPRVGSSKTFYDWDLAKKFTTDAIKSSSPALPLSGITTDSASDAYTKVLAHAGAIAPQRDSIDTRVVKDVRNQTGDLIDSEREVGGWSIYKKTTSKLSDSDKDGMPDTWENKHGLNPNNASDAKTKSNRGYMWIEEYVNSLLPIPGYDFYKGLATKKSSNGSEVDTEESFDENWAIRGTSGPPSNYCQIYKDTSYIAPKGFALAYNPHSAGKEWLVESYCTDEVSKFVLPTNAIEGVQYIWKYGYISESGSQWRRVTLSGPAVTNGPNWINGEVSGASYTLNSSEKNSSSPVLFLAFVCSWDDEEWKCGCRDASCMQSYWNLQAMNQQSY